MPNSNHQIKVIKNTNMNDIGKSSTSRNKLDSMIETEMKKGWIPYSMNGSDNEIIVCFRKD